MGRELQSDGVHSSLKSLTLYGPTPSLLSPLISNTCLTELYVTTSTKFGTGMHGLAPVISELVASNKTLKHLTIGTFKFPQYLRASSLNAIVKSLQCNKTLLKLTLVLDYPEHNDANITHVDARIYCTYDDMDSYISTAFYSSGPYLLHL